jgi:hypothetical protein
MLARFSQMEELTSAPRFPVEHVPEQTFAFIECACGVFMEEPRTLGNHMQFMHVTVVGGYNGHEDVRFYC